jgi:hypothetical protein
MLFPHSLSPERNLTHPDIISFTVIFTRLMHGIRWRILEYTCYDNAFATAHTEIACDPQVWSHVEALIRRQIGATRAP